MKRPPGSFWQCRVWPWFTVLFANFAEAMAEGRGKAQAERRARHCDSGRRSWRSRTPRRELHVGQWARCAKVTCCSSKCISFPGDGEVIPGVASVDESAMTGESAPVIRESGGDPFWAVTGSTRAVRLADCTHHGRLVKRFSIGRSPWSKRSAEDAERDRVEYSAGRLDHHALATATLLPFSLYSVQAAGQGTPVT